MDDNTILDLQSFPNELRLLLAILSLEAHPAVKDEIKERAKTADWLTFLDYARHHRVYSLVYHKLKSNRLIAIPPNIEQALAQDYRKNAFKMLQLAGQLDELCRAFHQAGIRVLVLKGPTLALELYQDLSMRTSKDLDLLIAIEDLEQAEQLMAKLGFVVKTPVPRIFNDWKWRAHHQAYYHPEKQVQVEIHWRMQPNFSQEPSFDELWERRMQSSPELKFVYSLSRADLFVYLCLHGARHGWFRLRWVLDISLLVSQISQSEYSTILTLSKSSQSLPMIGQGFILAHELLHAPLPDACRQFMEQRLSRRYARVAAIFIREKVQLHPLPKTPRLRRLYRRYLRNLKSPRQKIRYYFSALYPNSWDAQQVPLPKFLNFSYVLLRPVFWLCRRMGWMPDVKHDGMGA